MVKVLGAPTEQRLILEEASALLRKIEIARTRLNEVDKRLNAIKKEASKSEASLVELKKSLAGCSQGLDQIIEIARSLV